MTVKITQADAFTNAAFKGNPAAVCLLTSPREEDWMQNVAREMNLSETAFLDPREDGFNLRWFTPGGEVDLCGHATLASAHVLWEEGILSEEKTARFFTRSGWLTASLNDGWIEMDFPSTPDEPFVPDFDLAGALGTALDYIGKNQFDCIALVKDEETLRNLRPDFYKLASFPIRGAIVTCRSDSSDYDFVSRFFAPGLGVDEDPVTGSAHCCLAPFWNRRIDRTEFTAYQASMRGGVVRARLNGDRVLLSGQAVTVLRGELVY